MEREELRNKGENIQKEKIDKIKTPAIHSRGC
jgi:hypothetical protein